MRRYLLTRSSAGILISAQAQALPLSNEKTLDDATEVLDDLTASP